MIGDQQERKEQMSQAPKRPQTMMEVLKAVEHSLEVKLEMIRKKIVMLETYPAIEDFCADLDKVPTHL